MQLHLNAISSVWTFPDYNANKYILQFEQIHFDIWTNTLCEHLEALFPTNFAFFQQTIKGNLVRASTQYAGIGSLDYHVYYWTQVYLLFFGKIVDWEFEIHKKISMCSSQSKRLGKIYVEWHTKTQILKCDQRLWAYFGRNKRC